MILQRFKSFSDYSAVEAELLDGTFFIIADTGQFGAIVDKGERWNILSPPNTLKDFELPEGDVVITQRDTVHQAICKLAKQIQDLGDNVEEAKNTANDAMTIIKNFEFNGDYNAEFESRLTQLESKIVMMSESEFDELEGIDQNKIYYIYEND